MLLEGHCSGADIFWLLPLLVKVNAVTYEVSMINHSQDITKKQFQRQLPVPPQQKNNCTISIWKKNILLFFKKNNGA